MIPSPNIHSHSTTLVACPRRRGRAPRKPPALQASGVVHPISVSLLSDLLSYCGRAEKSFHQLQTWMGLAGRRSFLHIAAPEFCMGRQKYVATDRGFRGRVHLQDQGLNSIFQHPSQRVEYLMPLIDFCETQSSTPSSCPNIHRRHVQSRGPHPSRPPRHGGGDLLRHEQQRGGFDRLRALRPVRRGNRGLPEFLLQHRQRRRLPLDGALSLVLEHWRGRAALGERLYGSHMAGFLMRKLLRRSQ